MPFKSTKGSKSLTVQKEGYLSVKCNASALIKSREKSWQQKYIVLRKSLGDGTCLERYENFEAFIAHKNPVKLRLDGIDYIGPVDLSKEYSYAFILFGGGQSQLEMAAKNDAERSEWLKALNHCLENRRKLSSTSSATSPTIQGGYAVKLKDYECTANQDILRREGSRDYIMNIGTRNITLVNVDARGEQKLVLSWLLENIKSYESRPLEQNPSQKLLSIDTGRSSSTGQGTFNFFTLHGDQIKKQISQNVKRTYFKKMTSQDSFNTESLYGSSPESAKCMSTSPRFGSPHSSPRRSLSAKEGPIPFHKYDPPAGSDRNSYAPYIQQPNGYIDIFTDPRKVEENRNRRHGSRSSISTCRSPSPDDHPVSHHLPSPERYVQVLPSGELDPGSGYLDVLPEDAPDLGNYLEVLNEESHQYIEVLADEKSTSVSDDHAYIEVLGDNEIANRPHAGISRESSEDVEIYIDVEENQQKIAYEMHVESREHFESGGKHVESSSYESHEQHFKTHSCDSETNHTSCISTREVHVTCNSMSHEIQHQTREGSTSVYSPRWPASGTPHTSADFSSLSSENDVFQDREMAIVPEVFAEETTSSNDVPTISDVVRKNSDDGPKRKNLNSSPVKSENFTSEDDFTKSKEFLTKPVPVPRKSTLTGSKSATLPTKSEGLPTNSDVKSSDVNETRNDLTATPGNDRNNRNSKAKSWHSENENGNDLSYASANSTSTSESENTRDCSEDENSEENAEDSFVVETRYRSKTVSEIHSTSMLQAFERQLTNPQLQLTNPQFTSNKHPPLTREARFTEEQIIAQLENPILGVCSLPNRNSNSSDVKFKYICLNCGWHKKWKKRASLTPSIRSKQCPQCHAPVTKQSKDKSGGFISKIIKSRRSSDEKIDKKLDLMKPERPTAVPTQPFFLKNFQKSAAFNQLGRHSPLDPIRSGMGIAPSPLQALSAISIDGEATPRGSISNDGSTSSLGKNPLSSSLSDSGLTSPTRTVSPTPQPSKGSTLAAPGSFPLGRTKSSPPLSGGAESGSTPGTLDVQEFEKVPRKNSGTLPTLPSLPEVEDPSQSNHQRLHTPPPGTPPPVIPPRNRELPPPLPPRRGSSPLVPREEPIRLRRTQTDPNSTVPIMPAQPSYPNSTASVMPAQPSYPNSTASVMPTQASSPQAKRKIRISRTLTDPGDKFTTTNESIRNAVSLGNLLENGNDELEMMKIISLSLGDELDSDAPPPPLPPRRCSGQTQSSTVTPSRAPSNENGHGCDSPRIEPRTATEARRHLPERTVPGSASPKLPLAARRSVEAKRDFQNRKAMYSTHVGE